MLRKFGCDWLSDKCSRIGKFSKIWPASSPKDFSKVGSDKIFLSLEPFAELEDFKMRIENVKSKSSIVNVIERDEVFRQNYKLTMANNLNN